jgi:two-component system, NarL family, sensor histidine kinase UhpB
LLALVESQLILKSLTLAPSDEIYILDANTLALLYASDEAQKKIGSDDLTIVPEQLEAILGVSPATLNRYVYQQRNKKALFELSVNQPLPEAGVHKNQLRVMLIQSGQTEYILVTKSDISPNEKVVMALSESESRFQAIVSNIPGLVFQMQMTAEHEVSFRYVSDACEALLGMTAAELQQDAQLLFSIMNTRDRQDLRAKLINSAQSLEKLDWEGRVWIDGWQDTKWINLRATISQLGDGVVQWDGIMLNITQSKLEKLEIEQSRRELEQLTAHMNQVKEQERISIAREIHDDLGGNLTAIKMGLNAIAQQIAAGNQVSLEQTSGLESIVNRTFESVHRISGNLRPSILDLGIVDAIEWQVTQFKKQVGAKCAFSTNQSDIMVSTEQAMALFRICQESLSNIAKYAKATSVNVSLEASDDEVTLQVVDNGIGISDVDKLKTNSFGLRGMQERVTALSGSLSIGAVSPDVSGTKVQVTIPL